MRILGVDPGLCVTGYGVLEERGADIHLVAAGSIRTSNRHPLPGRLNKIFSGLREVLEQTRPEVMAVENTFLSKNFSAVLKLGQACGVALLAAELSDIPVFEYAPRVVKLAVTGTGAADKEQVLEMVLHHLIPADRKQIEDCSHHVSDALAVGICHLQSHIMRELTMIDSPLR